MDDFLHLATFIVALGGLSVVLSVLRHIRALSQRMDALEVDRAWFNNHREEQLQSLQAEILELRSQVADLLQHQLGTRRDPDDPR